MSQKLQICFAGKNAHLNLRCDILIEESCEEQRKHCWTHVAPSETTAES